MLEVGHANGVVSFSIHLKYYSKRLEKLNIRTILMTIWKYHVVLGRQSHDLFLWRAWMAKSHCWGNENRAGF